ncbi:4Fe-4S dicluster domain-containing protein [Crateriforma conspicua]|uniref:4Fe-4S dicluster domain-containing protein n=1 Tax=Crateriforma conspicua TaxID=2527996 RepID=UPI00118997C1|nr:Ferredoxin [Crateriforma conspicua]
MSYVVTEACVGCLDRSCIQSCPESCFYLAPLANRIPGQGVVFAGTDDSSTGAGGMVMIAPDECTNCGACETECPVEAIYEDSSVPEEFTNWIAINARYTRSLSVERKEGLRQHPQ